MQFPKPLIKAQFSKRYKRFFADVTLANGETMIAHVPNTGSLKTCLFPGAECSISLNDNPERKLKATLHFLRTPTSWVGVDTSLPNALVFEAWENRQIDDWKKFGFAKREHKISKETRLDLVLAKDEASFLAGRSLHFIEVKNVTYGEGDLALFPDAETTRGQKHLQELMALKKLGHTAEIAFVVQREDSRRLAPAADIDPVYARLLNEARAAGVAVRALACAIDPLRSVTIAAPLALWD